jgi:hypothetical protein
MFRRLGDCQANASDWALLSGSSKNSGSGQQATMIDAQQQQQLRSREGNDPTMTTTY